VLYNLCFIVFYLVHFVVNVLNIGTWNVRSLYRAGSLTAAARELARYKLDLVDVQEVGQDKRGTVRAGDYNSFHAKGNENSSIGNRIF